MIGAGGAEHEVRIALVLDVLGRGCDRQHHGDTALVDHGVQRLGGARIELADEGVDILAVDQLARDRDCLLGLGGGIAGHQLQHASMDAALGVDVVDGERGAAHDRGAAERAPARQRTDPADLQGLLGHGSGGDEEPRQCGAQKRGSEAFHGGPPIAVDMRAVVVVIVRGPE